MIGACYTRPSDRRACSSVLSARYRQKRRGDVSRTIAKFTTRPSRSENGIRRVRVGDRRLCLVKCALCNRVFIVVLRAFCRADRRVRAPADSNNYTLAHACTRLSRRLSRVARMWKILDGHVISKQTRPRDTVVADTPDECRGVCRY